MEAIFFSDVQLAKRYNVHRSTIWRWAKEDPSFPKPIILSNGCTRWDLRELEAWEQCPRELQQKGG